MWDKVVPPPGCSQVVKGPREGESVLTLCPARVFSSRKPGWRGSWGLLLTRAYWHLHSEQKADSEDLSSRMLLQYIWGWRKEQGGVRRLPCQCLQNLDVWQAEHQVNCSWSRKSGVEEAGVGRWLPSFEITGFTLLCFLVWPPLSLWAFGGCCPFYLQNSTKSDVYRRECLSTFRSR